jgi:thiosulfate reductase cytochrome b subunit
MAESAYFSGIALQDAKALGSPRHSVLVRVTHWINSLSFFGLLLSGITILLAHPRLYWGETGVVGTPSLFDLPLPFVLELQIRGPGRYLHFFFAWVCVLNGLLYVLSGIFSAHFRRNLLPAGADLSTGCLSGVISDHLHLKRPTADSEQSYNTLQRLAYLTVVFVLLPLMLVTGLAMSPAVTSVVPLIVTIFGGQQSARTIHFFVACFLVLFFVVHVGMVWMAGFTRRVRSMITGYSAARKERS